MNKTESAEKDNYDINGTINTFHPKEIKYVQSAELFSLQLININNSNVLVEKIIKPLKDL